MCADCSREWSANFYAASAHQPQVTPINPIKFAISTIIFDKNLLFCSDSIVMYRFIPKFAAVRITGNGGDRPANVTNRAAVLSGGWRS